MRWVVTPVIAIPSNSTDPADGAVDVAQDANIVGTEQVFAACERFDVGFAVIASSGAIYAPIDGELIEDDTPSEVIDNYSLCKIANEAQARLWSQRTGGLVRVARIFNTVGHDDPNGHLIPDILAQIPAGAESATISLGNTTTRRDYIHADDTAPALLPDVVRRPAPPATDVQNELVGSPRVTRQRQFDRFLLPGVGVIALAYQGEESLTGEGVHSHGGVPV